MIKLKAYSYDDMIDGKADIDVKYYTKEDADTAIATLQGANDEKAERIVELQKQVDELNDKCNMHNFFWEGCGFAKRGFKNTIELNEAFDRIEAENAQLKKEIGFMHSNCKWNAGDGCARLLGEKLALVNDIEKVKADASETLALLEERNKQVGELKSDIADLRDDKKLTDAILDERNAEIAELKAQKAQAEDDCAYWKNKAQRERHHKYKRCLAMARWCVSMMTFNSKYGTDKKWHLFKKWHKHWMDLAEKFKPNNSTAQ